MHFAAMDVTSQLESLHSTLTLVLTRLDALENQRSTDAGTETTRRGVAARGSRTRGSAEDRTGQDRTRDEDQEQDDDRREVFSDAVETEEKLPKLISNQKEKLAAIPELKVPEDWPRFLSQLTLILDAAYPWVADWMQRITMMQERPTRTHCTAWHRVWN